MSLPFFNAEASLGPALKRYRGRASYLTSGFSTQQQVETEETEELIDEEVDDEVLLEEFGEEEELTEIDEVEESEIDEEDEVEG